MTGFLEIALIAFGAQLAVLPGEKVQFIIAGLSTRYHPLLVVGAAGSAFAGWTVVEIAFGEAIQRILSPALLGAFTGVLFLVFAVLLWRSAPRPGESVAETDGGVMSGVTVDGDGEFDLDVSLFGREVPSYLGGFLPIFAMMAAGEFGDKTQIVTIGLAAKYGASPAIWTGEMLAIIPVSLANAYFFNRFAHRVDARKAHFFSAALFAFFAFDTFLGLTQGWTIWGATVERAVETLLAG